MNINKDYQMTYALENKSYKNLKELRLKMFICANENEDIVFNSYNREEEVHFEVSKRLVWSNSFNPVFSGSMEMREEGVEIIGKFMHYDFAPFFVWGMYGWSIFMMFLSFWISGFGIQILYFISFPCFLVVFQWLSTRFSMNKRKEIIDFVEKVCEKES